MRFRIEIITDVTIAELKGRLRSLPPESVVFWATFMRDREQTPLSFAQSVKFVVDASLAPAYGFMDHSASHGAIGGYVVSGFAQGETAARLGQRIRAGDPVVSGYPFAWNSRAIGGVGTDWNINGGPGMVSAPRCFR
jgi:hypothetical protein